MFRNRSTRRPAHPRPRSRRRGTIIILVVGILAVLSVATVSYMTVVRLDRSSTFAYANSLNYKQQVNAVTGHIRALLAADLFGNKLVTPTVPERLQQAHVWPRAFEDGDFADYPSTDEAWLNDPFVPDPVPTNNRNVLPLEIITRASTAGSVPPLERYTLARPDDAWLSPSEPVDARDDDGVWDSWPQVTNLRSAYLWNDDLNGDGVSGDPNDAAWVRDHGRFVDIAEWFVKSQGDPLGLPRADPGLDPSLFVHNAWSGQIGAGDSDRHGPRLGVDNIYAGLASAAGGNPNDLGVDLSVFPMQMSRMEDFLDGAISDPDEPAEFLNADSRLFADADGDGRADSRWQQLDSLGELYGLKWLVAARIIDNGAMINANTSLEFHHPSADPDEAGAAATPADIDLYRLLRRASASYATANPIHPDVEASNISDQYFENMWDAHRVGHLNLPGAFDNLDNEFMLGLTQTTSGDLISTDPVARAEKRAFYRYFGSAPFRPQVGSIPAAPLGDEVDLRAYWGFNYSGVVSKVEQRFDGIDAPGGATPTGFLPNQDTFGGGPSDAVGPLRSRENERALRTFRDTVVGAAAGSGTFLNDPGANDPTANSPDGKIARIQRDLRRHITTYNGVSRLAPGAPWNPASPAASSYSAVKVPVGFPWRLPVADPADLVGLKETVQGTVISAFDSFMSALAPLALDIPTLPGLTQSSLTAAQSSANFHYGGGSSGPAADAGINDASYATLRALSLAVNLADAIDHDGDGSTEIPTVARFRKTLDPSSCAEPVPPVRSARALDLSPVLLQGTIHPNALLNAAIGSDCAGVELIGLDRQPFIRELHTFAAYAPPELKGDPSGLTGIPNVGAQIDPNNPDHQLGSIISVELGNPWPEPVNVRNYAVRITDGSSSSITLRLGRLEESGQGYYPGSGGMEPDPVIPPGQFAVFTLVHEPDAVGATWQRTFDHWLGYMGPRGLALGTNHFILETTPGADVAALDPIAGVSGAIDPSYPVLFQPFLDSDAISVLLIYMDDPDNTTGSTPEPEYLVDRWNPPGGAQVLAVETQTLSLSNGLVAIPPPTEFMGQHAVSATAYRPTDALPGGSFPSYVVDRRSQNVASTHRIGNTHHWGLRMGVHVAGTLWFVEALVNQTVGDQSTVNCRLGEDKGALANLPPFQLFVPDGPLRSTSELLFLCPFAHTYVNPNTTSPPLARTAAQLSAWTTVSEHLGQDRHFFYDGTTTPNPYLGALDPTRYVLGESGSGADLGPVSLANNFPMPDALTVPLALRVPDGFVALSGPEDILSGVINVNTAPLEVLECIPLLAPEFDIDGTGGSTAGLTAWNASNASRAQLLRDYRDLTGSTFDQSTPGARTAATMIPGLRSALRAAPSISGGSGLNRRGLTTTAEAALLTQWDPATGAISGPIMGYEDFGWVAGSDSSSVNQQTVGPGVTARYDNANKDFLEDLDQSGGTLNDPVRLAFVTGFNPIDDAEERLALARPLFDLASTRSDVFTAWFVLRAYDPEQMEAIQVLTADDRARAALLNEQISAANPSPGLAPVYESRWLAVLDRSNVRRPTDRPRVLLLVELPVN